MNLHELPGSELIFPGLEDLRRGETNTVEALLVTIAATRLTSAGLDIPRDRLDPEPEMSLYLVAWLSLAALTYKPTTHWH
jgi:hypothetical protein